MAVQVYKIHSNHHCFTTYIPPSFQLIDRIRPFKGMSWDQKPDKNNFLRQLGSFRESGDDIYAKFQEFSCLCIININCSVFSNSYSY